MRVFEDAKLRTNQLPGNSARENILTARIPVSTAFAVPRWRLCTIKYRSAAFKLHNLEEVRET